MSAEVDAAKYSLIAFKRYKLAEFSNSDRVASSSFRQSTLISYILQRNALNSFAVVCNILFVHIIFDFFRHLHGTCSDNIFN